MVLRKMIEQFDGIVEERVRQENNHPGFHKLNIMEMTGILIEEAGEAQKAANDDHFNKHKNLSSLDGFRMEIVQVIATGYRILENIDYLEAKREGRLSMNEL
jgi:NTP pyrophosphatase (non-canonical NTP hydrolase)